MSSGGRAGPGSPAQDRAVAGKYMTFKVAGETYGLEILAVREIIRLVEITRVPRASDIMRGVRVLTCDDHAELTHASRPQVASAEAV